MNINAKVALDKQKHPERYCPQKGCLWKTAKLNHATQQHEGGGYCPRHKRVTAVLVGELQDVAYGFGSLCTCGHERRDHIEEPPYECFAGSPDNECDCMGFTYPTREESAR